MENAKYLRYGSVHPALIKTKQPEQTKSSTDVLEETSKAFDYWSGQVMATSLQLSLNLIASDQFSPTCCNIPGATSAWGE
jgi:hypothetical protein